MILVDQLSEYDSDSSDDEDHATHEEHASEAVSVNLLTRTVRMRRGRQITLSNRVLASYLSTKKAFLSFCRSPKSTRNFNRSVEKAIYMLQLKAEVEIRLFNVFFWERKRDSGFRRKKCGMRDFREKGARMPDQDPPFQTLPDPSRPSQKNTQI